MSENSRGLDKKLDVNNKQKLTPLAHLDAVEIGGATITKATLNNMDDIHRKGVKIGAEVFVRRSNDVIPEIMGIVEGSKGTDIIAPTECPECSGKLENDGVHLFCKNSLECPAQQIGRIVHFGSREAMNIDTFSEKTAEQLWEAGLLRNLTDLYQLDKEKMITLERFGKRKAEKLIDAIEVSKTRPLDAFLYGLGIRHAGKGTVERLLRYYNTLEEIADASLEQLCEIEDIGDVVAESIYNFFRNEKNQQMIQELKDLGLEMKKAAPIQTSSNKFEDMVFVITGTLSQSRKHFENIIKDNGGKISGSVTKKTNYVLVGEDAGSKEEKANKLGIPTLSEEAFNELVNS